MDNKELAKLLLCEASNLLEDARARYTDKKIEEARKNYQRDKKLVEQNAKDPSCLDKYKNERVRITNINYGKYDGGFTDINPITSDKDYVAYKNARKGTAKLGEDSQISKGNKNDLHSNATVRQPSNDKADYSKESIEPFVKSSMKKLGTRKSDKTAHDIERNKKYKDALDDARKRYNIHKHINDRTKPQNEAISTLLTEATLLLNEGAKYRKRLIDISVGGSSYKNGKNASKLYAKAKEDEAIYDNIKSKKNKSFDELVAMKMKEMEMDANKKTADFFKEKGKKVSNNVRSFIDKNTQNEAISTLLTEAALLLNETNYSVERGNLLYADGKFIGSFDNEKEKQELINEYEEEQENK